MSGSYRWTVSARIFCFASIIATSPLSCSPTEREILWHERIVALWKDGELSLAQDEINQLKKELPQSEILEKLTELEAHVALDLGAYTKARDLLKARTDLRPLYAKALFALEAYDELTELPEKNIEALVGLAHLKLQHFEKADSLLEKAEPAKAILIGRIDALLHLGNKSASTSLIDQLLPLLSDEEKRTYQRLKAHLVTDKAEAAALLKELVSSGFSPASEDLLDLLGSIENPKERLELIELIEPHLPSEKSALIAFWKGHTLAALGEFSRAKAALQNALTAEKLPGEFEAKTRAALIYLAEKLEDETLAHFLVESAKERDARTAALDLKWRLATARGSHKQALRTAHESLKERANVSVGLLLVAHSAYHCKEPGEVVAAALRFIEEDAPEHREMLQKLLGLTAVGMQDKEAALAALQKWQQAFGAQESLQRIEGEVLISLGRKKEAAALLEKLPSSGARDSLLCICYSPGEPLHASHFGERALQEGELCTTQSALHLELFNLYCDIWSKELSLPKSHPSFGQSPLDLAAEHLFAVFKQAPDQISQRNRVWLCAHFLAKPASSERGLALFSHIANPSPQLICAAAKATPKAESSKQLLQRALTESEKSGDLILTCAVLTALGEVELKMGEKSAARAYFERAAHMKVQSYEADVAKLALYKLDAASGQIDKARAKSDLKDIQLRKTLEKEPLFLDAALLYVDICASDSPEKKQRLLEQMQEDFCSGTTLFGKHYQKQRAKLPEKEKLLANYMLFVDLGIESLAAGSDQKRLRGTLAKLESSAPALKATSPELALRCYELREQIRSVLQ